MLVRLYRCFLRLFPSRYRSTFAPEMTNVFQQAEADAWSKGIASGITFSLREIAGLILGAFREHARDWAWQPEFSEDPVPSGNAARSFDGVPSFYTAADFFPRRSAMFEGAILSLVLFSAVTAAFEYGVNHRVFRFPVGRSLEAGQPQVIETGDAGFVAFGKSVVSSNDGAVALVLGKPPAMPIIDIQPGKQTLTAVWSNVLWVLRVRPHFAAASPRGVEVVRPASANESAATYFRVIRVLAALDADHDGVISASEIANAPAALLTLDTDHDGALSPEECGRAFADDPAQNARMEATLDPDALRRARLTFMRIHPVLAALDADHDGVISAAEIQNAPAALKTLDKNGDGRLTPDELIPPRR